jgi:hypothetical protein
MCGARAARFDRMTESIFCSKVSVDTIVYLGLELECVSELRRKYRELPQLPLPPTGVNATAFFEFYQAVRGPLEEPIHTNARCALNRIKRILENVSPICHTKELDELNKMIDLLATAFAEMRLRLDHGDILRRLVQPSSDWATCGERKH